MSCLMACDCDDCYEFERDTTILSIEPESREFLKENCLHWFKGYIGLEHICENCIYDKNIEFKDFFIIDGYGSVSVSDAYMKNDEFINNRKKELK